MILKLFIIYSFWWSQLRHFINCPSSIQKIYLTKESVFYFALFFLFELQEIARNTETFSSCWQPYWKHRRPRKAQVTFAQYLSFFCQPLSLFFTSTSTEIWVSTISLAALRFQIISNSALYILFNSSLDFRQNRKSFPPLALPVVPARILAATYLYLLLFPSPNSNYPGPYMFSLVSEILPISTITS